MRLPWKSLRPAGVGLVSFPREIAGRRSRHSTLCRRVHRRRREGSPFGEADAATPPTTPRPPFQPRRRRAERDHELACETLDRRRPWSKCPRNESGWLSSRQRRQSVERGTRPVVIGSFFHSDERCPRRRSRCGKHNVPNPEVWQQGTARSKAEERPAAECGHLLHGDCRRRGSYRGASKGDRFPSRGSNTQPPIPTLHLPFDDSMEGPKIT